MNRTF